MRDLTKAVLMGLSLAVSTAAGAVTVKVDGADIDPNGTVITGYTINVVDDNVVIDFFTADGVSIETTSTDPGPDPDPDPTPDPDPDPAPTPDVNIVSLTASATEVEKGDIVRISWDVQNALSCDTTWGLRAWRDYNLPNLNTGSVEIDIVALGEINFRLDCTGANNSTDSAIVTVISYENLPGQGTNSCPGPQVALDNGEIQWFNFFGAVWPNTNQTQVLYTLPATRSLAVKFNTGNFNGSGIMKTIAGVPAALREVAINQCPGRFNDSAPGCWERHGSGTQALLNWATDGSSTECALQANTDYYVNITYVDVRDAAGNLCSGTGFSACQVLLNPIVN